jgi:hypothetical protein
MTNKDAHFVHFSNRLELLDILRSELLNEIPKACIVVDGLKVVHNIYKQLYEEASGIIRPEFLLSELKFHVKHHFAVILYCLDELQFLVDGKIIRSNKFKLLKAREYVHPTRNNEFNGINVNQKDTCSLWTKSIEGYYFEEQQLLVDMRVSHHFIFNNHNY